MPASRNTYGWLAGIFVAIGVWISVATLRSGRSDGDGGAFAFADAAAFQDLLRSPDAVVADTAIEIWRLDPLGDAVRKNFSDSLRTPGQMKALFTAPGYVDTVSLRRMRTVEGGLVLTFAREYPFRAQRQVVIWPAKGSDVQLLFAHQIARRLGLIAPMVDFKRVLIAGKDKGICVVEERVGADFTEKQRMTDALFFEHAADPYLPGTTVPLMDDTANGAFVLDRYLWLEGALREGDFPRAARLVNVPAVASMLLMIHAEDRLDPLREEGHFIYRWTTGRFQPLYRSARTDARTNSSISDPLAWNMLTPWVNDSAFRAVLHAQRKALLEEEATLLANLNALKKTWLPRLVDRNRNEGRSREQVASAIDAYAARLLARLHDTNVRDWFPMPLVDHLGRTAPAPSSGTEPFWHDPGSLAAQWSKIDAMFGWDFRGDTLVIPRGRWAIDSDLIIPPGRKVLLEAGAILELGERVNLLSYSELHAHGTARQPATVRAMDPAKPFGTFALTGDDNMHCTFRHFTITRGNEGRLDGVYHSGMFSPHHTDLTMSHCRVLNNAGEDGFNLKYGDCEISDCVFSGGFADQVDLDYVKGSVTRCLFEGGGADSNGDGLDISGCLVLITDCEMRRNNDKGMSIGEATECMVTRCNVHDNDKGVVVKDLAVCHLTGNTITGNRSLFQLYRKKPMYGGSRLLLYPDNVIGEGQEAPITDSISMIVNAVMDEKVKSRFRALAPELLP